MKRVVEVAHLVNGELVSARRLSARRELLGVLSAALGVVASLLAAMAVAALVIRMVGRGIYAPWFVAVWAASGAGVTWLAVAAVRRRLRRYVLGARLDSDAFAAVDADLVRRERDHFSLTVVPGMKGHITGGRAPMPAEALVSDRPRTIPLEPGMTAELSLGSSTFAIRDAMERERGKLTISRDLARISSRFVVSGIQVAALGSLLCAVPLGQPIGDRAAHLMAPRITTPWEAEKWLRIEAQAQSRSLHQCFDPLPLSCQRSGYVGVGVALNREGEMRSNWIARSTYGSDCPVDQCMKDVVATWVFDPLPEAMRVVLPVQVLRTEKPLRGPSVAPVAQKAEARVGLGPDAVIEWGSGP